MTLHVLEDGGLRLAIDLQLQNGGEELFVHQQGEQVLVIQNDLLGLLMATVQDRRNFPCTTQAAARTLPCSFGRESATRSNEYFMVTPVRTKRRRIATNYAVTVMFLLPGSRRGKRNEKLIDVERADALLIPDAAHRLRQQSRHAQLADLLAAPRIRAQRNRVRHHQLIQLRLRDAVDGPGPTAPRG